jgi:hypothetical protein
VTTQYTTASLIFWKTSVLVGTPSIRPAHNGVGGPPPPLYVVSRVRRKNLCWRALEYLLLILPMFCKSIPDSIFQTRPATGAPVSIHTRRLSRTRPATVVPTAAYCVDLFLSTDSATFKCLWRRRSARLMCHHGKFQNVPSWNIPR